MQAFKKSIALLLVVTLLSGVGLFNLSSIIAFAEEESISNLLKPLTVDKSDPYNPVYFDENGNEVDMNALYDELADEDSSYNAGDLPASYDARKDNLITSVKYQGEYGTCWAHATMNCLEADAIKKGYYTKDTADFSESHLVWFANNPVDSLNNTSANDYKNDSDLSHVYSPNVGGNYFMALSALSRWEGIANEKDFPYGMNGYKDENRYNSGSGLIIDQMVFLQNADADEIKSWIIEHGAISIAYNSSTTGSNKDVYTSSQKPTHGVSVIGWDDNYSRDNFGILNRPKKNGAWLIKNSWGTDKGDNGYYWLSYETPIKMCTGFSVCKKDSYLNNYTYNGYEADEFDVSIKVNNWSTANVFTAKDNEKLSKVSFYTARPDLDVSIKVYKLDNNFSNPVSGELVSNVSKSYHNIGLYSVDLKEKVDLSKGQIFSVVVEYSTSASEMGIYCENTEGGHFKSAKGESWFGLDGEWLDTMELGYGNNYINAITESTSGSSTPTTPETPKIKLSATPASITVDEGATKTVTIKLSENGENLNLNAACSNDSISSKWESPNFSGTSTNIIVTGNKAGTSSLTITLSSIKTGSIIDKLTIPVTVKAKSTPTPTPQPGNDLSKAKVTLKQPESTTLRIGLDTLYLHATAENLPNDADIVLAVPDGVGTTVNGECVDCNVSGHPKGCHAFKLTGNNPGTVTVTAKIVDAKGNYLQYNGKDISSNSLDIKVQSPSFFVILIDLILSLFGGGLGKVYNS